MARGFNFETTLGACWSKIDKSWRSYYPRKEDGWHLHDLLRSNDFKTFVAELEERGYDPETLRISVKKKIIKK
jgi:hypothetical protein